MAKRMIPDIVIGRLPVYLRALGFLIAEGRQITSSQELGDRLGISSAQIRKDLSHFGEFGKQGTGYSIAGLQDKLREILHIEREWPIIIVGAGHIGNAVANYSGFKHRGFRVCAVFDADPAKFGDTIGGQIVQPFDAMPEIVKQRNVQLAMIAVPAHAAQQVADQCVQAGITAILNYAPTNLSVPAHVRVENIDPVLHLQHMTYYLSD